MNLRLGINHPGSDCKCIDSCNNPVNRIIRHIADLVVARNARRNRSHQKLRLMHSSVIGANRIVRKIDGAVQKFRIRIVNGRAQGFIHLRRRNGKHHLRVIRHCRINRLANLFIGTAVFILLRLYQSAKLTLHIVAAQLMSVNPAGIVRRLGINKSHMKGIFPGIMRLRLQNSAQRIKCSLLASNFVRRLYQCDAILVGINQKLLPQAVNPIFQKGSRFIDQALNRIEIQIGQEGISVRKGHPALFAFMVIHLFKHGIGCLDVFSHFRRPGLVHGLSEAGSKLPVASLLRENNVIHPVDIKILEELAVHAVFLCIRLLRHDTDHIGMNGRGSDKTADRHALIALFHVKSRHILIGLDRVTDSFFHLGLIKIRPLAGKFRVRFQNRHKIRRKCRGSAFRSRSVNHIQRNFQKSYLDLGKLTLAFNDVIQNSRIGRTFLQCRLFHFAKPQLPCSNIIRFHRLHRPSLSSFLTSCDPLRSAS